MQLQKYKKMEINEPDNKIFSSSEVIEIVLKAVGLTRENLSTYKQYQYSNGFFLRLRVSNHGIYLHISDVIGFSNGVSKARERNGGGTYTAVVLPTRYTIWDEHSPLLGYARLTRF